MGSDDPVGNPPDTRWLALGLCFIVGFRLLLCLWSKGQLRDFELLYHAAEHLLRGQNPYPIATQWYPWPLFYPMPAVLLAVPFVALPLAIAEPVFDIAVGAVFAYGLWRFRGNYALLALVSGSYLYALRLSQTTPLMVAATLIPALGGLLTVKPNVGLALWLSRPSRAAVIGGVVLIVVGLVVLPTWPRDWLVALQQQSAHLRPPVVRPFGFLLLLAGLRWRTPEGRLLLALSLIPQNTQPHDLVPLVLIPANLTEMGIYVAGTWVALAVTADVQLQLHGEIALTQTLARIWPVTLLTVYLPMLYLVLKRPNRPPVSSNH